MMNKKCKCPHFIRKTHSYRYSGFKCELYIYGNYSMGEIQEWHKEKRDKKINEHCHGNFSECNLYKFHKEK